MLAERLRAAGVDSAGFAAFAASDGRGQLAATMNEAHERGVFGVLSFLWSGELFWGREHLPAIAERMERDR